MKVAHEPINPARMPNPAHSPLYHRLRKLPRPAYFLICASLTLGLTAAIIDSVNLTSRAALKQSILMATLPALAVAARVAVPFLVLAVSAALALSPLTRLCWPRLFFAMAGVVGSLWVADYYYPGLVAGSYLRFLLFGAGSVLMTAALYWIGGLAAVDRSRGRYLAALAGSIPLVLLEAWWFTWFLRDSPTHFSRENGTGATIAYCVLVAATLLPAVLRARRLQAWRWATLAVLACALLPLLSLTGRTPAVSKVFGSKDSPPVIFITVDSLRADALSVYGSSTPTPHIDELASHSVVFKRAVAPASWTIPSLLSVMTGVTPYVHDVGRGHDPFSFKRYKGPLPTWAQLLSESGYRTSAIVGNPLLDRMTNVTDGFDDYEVFDYLPIGANTGGNWLAGRNPLHFVSGGTTEVLTDEAIALLRHRADEQIFLWLHYYDPHWPYAPPPSYSTLPASTLSRWASYDQVKAFNGENKFSVEERGELISLYLSEVQLVDDHIGRLTQALRELKLFERAIVILTSDHGEEFWEHGRLGHGHALYGETVNVPLLIKLPNAQVTKSVQSIVSTQALLPTILDLLSIETPDSRAWLSSLAPLLKADEADLYSELLLGAGSYKLEDFEMLIQDEKKLIRQVQSDLWQLYDLEADPQERRPLALEDHSSLVDAGRSVFEQVKEDAPQVRQSIWGSKAEIEDRDSDRDRLRSLGYL